MGLRDMADGAPRLFGKKRSLADDAEDTDPRYSTRKQPEKPHFGGKSKKQPRIAFTGEEFGFGYQATERFLKEARDRGTVADGGVDGVSGRARRTHDDASKNSRFDYHADVPQPLRTKEQALMAVKSQTADFALVPFYSPYAGYDFETLRSMSSLFTVLGVEQVEATDDLCLAVHESQLYDLIQSSHPGSGFSSLQRRLRKSWGTPDTDSGNTPGGFEQEMPRAGLPIDMADQKLIRDRIDKVFAGPEASRRCKSKLDGLRAIGIDVQETTQMVEPHRELAKLARSAASSARQTNTHFDAFSGETRFTSSMSADTQNNALFGMVLPYEVAMRSSDYLIIDHKFDDAPPAKTRFLVVENNPDFSLYEEKYRTTDARTGYWVKRAQAIANPQGAFGAGFMQMLGSLSGLTAMALIAFGVYGLTANTAPFLEPLPALSWLTTLPAGAAILIGGAIALASWVLVSVRSAGESGVRMMFRFRRDGTAASIGDIENYLRNYGVRHTIVRLGEDSEGDAPASIVLDVEFDRQDFSYGPFAMFSRRLRGSVVNGAFKKVFQRWKNRGVTVLAAMPFDREQAQLPKHRARRWWSDAILAWTGDFAETMFIRLSRLLLIYAIPSALILYAIWKFVLNG